MKLFFLVLCSFLLLPAYNQTDTFLVVTEYQYDLTNGVSMFNRYASNQKTYNTERVLLREVTYTAKTDTTNPAIKDISYIFYTENKIKSLEKYNLNAKLIEALKYNYDKKGLLKTISKYTFNSENELKPIETTTFKYKKDSLISYKTISSNKVELQNATISRLPNQKTTHIDFTNPSTEKQNSILSISTTQIFEQDRLIEENITKTYANKEQNLKLIKYQYDKNNQIKESSSFENGILIDRIEFERYEDNWIKSISTFNSNKKRIAFTTYERSKKAMVFGGLNTIF